MAEPVEDCRSVARGFGVEAAWDGELLARVFGVEAAGNFMLPAIELVGGAVGD